MGVKDLWVFGSVARGEANPHDVVVLVEFVEKRELLNFMSAPV